MVEYSKSCGKLRSTPLGELGPVIRLFEGIFLGSLNDLAQESGNSPRVPCPRSESFSLSARSDTPRIMKKPGASAAWNAALATPPDSISTPINLLQTSR